MPDKSNISQIEIGSNDAIKNLSLDEEATKKLQDVLKENGTVFLIPYISPALDAKAKKASQSGTSINIIINSGNNNVTSIGDKNKISGLSNNSELAQKATDNTKILQGAAALAEEKRDGKFQEITDETHMTSPMIEELARECSTNENNISVQAKSLKDSCQIDKDLFAGSDKEYEQQQNKYIGQVKRLCKSYKKNHAVFLSAITRDKNGEYSTEYYVARQLTKILRKRGISVFWWEDPEGNWEKTTEYNRWRTIGTKIAMGLAFSTVFIGLAFDSVTKEKGAYQYRWLDESRYTNFRYEVRTFHDFLGNTGTDKAKEFVKDIVNPNALPNKRSMFLFSYGDQKAVREGNFFNNTESCCFEEVSVDDNASKEVRVNKIIERVLPRIYENIIITERDYLNKNYRYNKSIRAAAVRAWKLSAADCGFEDWFKTVATEEKFSGVQTLPADVQDKFHPALNTPSDRYFKYTVLDNKGNDVTDWTAPDATRKIGKIELFLERDYDADRDIRYQVCMVINDWNDSCLYKTNPDRFNAVHKGSPPSVDGKTKNRYPLARFNTFSVDCHVEKLEREKKNRGKKSSLDSHDEFSIIDYTQNGGKYYLYRDLDTEHVMYFTAEIEFKADETKETEKYFLAFKYAVKTGIHYTAKRSGKKVIVRLEECPPTDELEGKDIRICLASSLEGEPYGNGRTQEWKSLLPEKTRYEFPLQEGNFNKLCFCNDAQAEDLMFLFLKEYSLKRERKWSDEKKSLRCPYCSQPIKEVSTLKNGHYQIESVTGTASTNTNLFTFIPSNGNYKISWDENGKIQRNEKRGPHTIEWHYKDKDDGRIHCLTCERNRFTLFCKLSHTESIKDKVANLKGNTKGKIRIIDAALPKRFTRGFTLGYVGAQGAGKSSFIAESFCLKLGVNHIQAGKFKTNDYLKLASHTDFDDTNLLMSETGNPIISKAFSNIRSVSVNEGLFPHVHVGYTKTVYGPNVHQTENDETVIKWLENYPFLLKFSVPKGEKQTKHTKEETEEEECSIISCFDFPGGATTTEDKKSLTILRDVDALMLFLDYRNFETVVSTISKAWDNGNKGNKEKERKGNLILAIVLCKFDEFDGIGEKASDSHQFNRNSYVRITPPSIDKNTPYNASNLAEYIDRCSIEVEGWLKNHSRTPNLWSTIDGIPQHKFFTVSALGNRHALDQEEDGSVRFKENPRGIELVYAWLAYQAGIID